MSRAFAPKDDPRDPAPASYDLPERDDAGYDAAAAAALLHGARVSDTATAEDATGYRWGDPHLRAHVERIRQRAIQSGDERLEQVADRFLQVK
jgi:hypothetical protein